MESKINFTQFQEAVGFLETSYKANPSHLDYLKFKGERASAISVLCSFTNLISVGTGIKGVQFYLDNNSDSRNKRELTWAEFINYFKPKEDL